MILRKKSLSFIESLPSIKINKEAICCLKTTKEYKSSLLEHIHLSKKRIYMTLLYFQDDQAGKEILTALYEKKQKDPSIDIKIFVDFLRAQRGLMGESASEGNVRLYREFHTHYTHSIEIYGIPIKSKEFLGVLHLKGFVFDHSLFYSGASINNVYCHQNERYRFDRYQIIKSPHLTDTWVDFIHEYFIHNDAVHLLTGDIPKIKQIKKPLLQLKKRLKQASYRIHHEPIHSAFPIELTPLVGFGGRNNPLNKVICQLIQQTQKEVIIFTPYFNFPAKIYSAIKKTLKKGIKVTIVVGDKSANDFYIEPHKTFNKIGILPYLYEVSLKRFLKNNQSFVDDQLLTIHLWMDQKNSFHLKGINSDRKNYLLTGHNINPRAWRLDIENGILLQDPHQQLCSMFDHEFSLILKNTQKVLHYDQLENFKHYRPEAQKLLKLAKRAQLDRLINHLL
jgi:CDP-diacylglycerol--serine O-phosphatidyltransferase